MGAFSEAATQARLPPLLSQTGPGQASLGLGQCCLLPYDSHLSSLQVRFSDATSMLGPTVFRRLVTHQTRFLLMSVPHWGRPWSIHMTPLPFELHSSSCSQDIA